MDEQNPSLPPAGWYSDPAEIGRQRYWNGSAWEQQAPVVPPAQRPVGTSSPAPSTAGGGLLTAAPRMVTFGEAVRSGFRKYVNTDDRATRAEYWWWALFVFAVGIVLAIADFALGTGELLGRLWSLGTALPYLAVGARRLRDAGCSPWNLLWGLLPVVGTIILLVKLCRPSLPVRPLRFASPGAVARR